MNNNSLITRIRQLNITSEMAYIASGASIALSIGIWILNQDDDRPHAERFGIFVGLWAPTLAILGNVLDQHEHRHPLPTLPE